MEKNITKLKNLRSCSACEEKGEKGAFEVQSKTIRKILQFAAAYRTEKVEKESKIDVFLN